MPYETEEAKERIRNTLIRQLPKNHEDVRNAQESDIRGYDMVLTLEGIKNNNIEQQLKKILERTNPHLYNSTNYEIDSVKHSLKKGFNIHIKLIAKKIE